MVVHKFHLVFLFMAIVLASLSASPVFAISDPSTIKLEQIAVFRNYIHANDLLMLVEYNLDYNPVPSEDPRSVYAIILLHETEEDDVVIDSVKGIRPILYYGHAYQSIYFTAAIATSKSLTWNMDDLKICLCPNPVEFPTSGPSNTYEQALTVGDTDTWIDGTLGETTPTLLGEKILEITENASIASGQEYTQTTDTGNKLSPAGGIIARKVIEGVRTIVPDIFAFTSDITEEPSGDAVYSGSAQGQDALEANLSDAFSDNLDKMGLSAFGPDKTGKGMIIGGLGFLLLAVSILGMIFNVTQAVTPAMVTGIPLVLAGSMLGVIPIGLVFATFFFVLVLFGITFIMSRMA